MEETNSIKSSKTDSDGEQFLTVIGPAFAWFGVQVCWAVLDGFATPLLLELGMNNSNVNYIWLVGPIAGIVVQPLVGSYSDLVKRRKPFIAAGCLSTITFLLLFSNSKNIAKVTQNATFALGFGIATVWLLDFSINVLMAPLRALASDSVSAEKQIYSMSWFAIFAGIAHIIGFLLGAITTDVPIVFAIAAGLILISCITTLVIVKAENGVNGDDMNGNGDNGFCLSGLINIYHGLFSLPLFLWKLMHTMFWTFVGFLPMWIYMTDYYGENVMKGDVHAPETTKEYQLYRLGVQYGNLGYSLQGIIILIFAYLAPYLAKKIGLKTFWMFSLFVYGCCFCVMPFIDNLFVVLALHALSGIGFATFMVYPWSIATRYTCTHDMENAGLALSVFHLSVCIPQLFTSFICGFIVDRFNDDVASTLFFGGCGAFIAALSILLIDTKYQKTEKSAYEVVSNEDIDDTINNHDEEDEIVELQEPGYL